MEYKVEQEEWDRRFGLSQAIVDRIWLGREAKSKPEMTLKFIYIHIVYINTKY